MCVRERTSVGDPHSHLLTFLADGRSDSRAVLHLDGADLLETLLGQVAALSEQVHPAALEVLKLKEVYLGGDTLSVQ